MNTERKKFSLPQLLIPIVIVILIIAFAIASALTPSYSVEEDSFVIHRNRGLLLISYLMSNGYEVDFADISNIELLPHSPRALSETIDSHAYRSVGDSMIGYFGEYYLNISEVGNNAPSLRITRYSGAPMVLHFPHGRTEVLYEQLRVAWRMYQEVR